MLGQILDLISFPITQFLLMLKDDRITSYLGVSVLGIAVTCMITMIVFNSLVSTVSSDVSSFATHLPKKKSIGQNAIRKLLVDLDIKWS